MMDRFVAIRERLARLAPGENRRLIRLALCRAVKAWAGTPRQAPRPMLARRYAGEAERLLDAADTRARARELHHSYEDAARGSVK